MAQTPGDKTEPSLELPSLKLPGFRRRKKARIGRSGGSSTPEEFDAPRSGDVPAEDPTPADVPLGEPAPEPEPTRQIAVAPEPEPYLPEPQDDSEPYDPESATEPAPPSPGAPAAPRRRAKRERSRRTRPVVPGRLAAALTGVVVGGAGAGATYAAMAGCKAVRGVSSCGGAPGFFILVAIVVLMTLFGALLLKAFRVGDPGSTSFLAVGVVTVVVMLALLDVIFSASMFVVVPVLSALAYLLAHWVTTRFADEETGRRDWT